MKFRENFLLALENLIKYDYGLLYERNLTKTDLLLEEGIET